MKKGRTYRHLLMAGSAAALFGAGPAAAADDFEWKATGYARAWTSFNLQSIPETAQDDRGELSMLRGSLLLDLDAKYKAVQFKAIGRADREYETSYLENLKDLSNVQSPGGQDIMDQYNKTRLRELWTQFQPVDNLNLRIGKQQVVWGETDFFQALDVVQGFDRRWHWWESEGDELRKSLWLVNATYEVPAVDGALQVLIRPGLDKGEDIGNTVDITGGRWRTLAYRGFDTLSVTRYNFHHADGDIDDTTYGARWNGIAGPVNYSVNYLKSFWPDMVLDTGPLFAGTGVPEWIYPEVDIYGATASYYSQALDAVFSTEVAYVPNAPFNAHSPLPFLPGGFGGVVEKDTVLGMLRMDKNIDLSAIIGTPRPSFFSLQIFDTWITDYKDSDNLAFGVGYFERKKEHNIVATAILSANYANDTINPSVALISDVSYGGYIVLPGVDFSFGDQWRLKVGAEFFIPDGHDSLNDISVPGLFDNGDQLFFRVTRLFN